MIASGANAAGSGVLQVYDLGKDGTGKPSEIYAVKDLTEAARNNPRGDCAADSYHLACMHACHVAILQRQVH